MGIFYSFLEFAYIIMIFGVMHKITLAFQVLEVSTQYLTRAKGIFLTAFKYWIMIVILLFSSLYAFACLCSVGLLGADHQNQRTATNDGFTLYILVISKVLLAFAAWTVIFMLKYSATYVIMVGTAEYYFTSNRQHDSYAKFNKGGKYISKQLGSLFIASIILPPVSFFRTILSAAMAQIEDNRRGNQS